MSKLINQPVVVIVEQDFPRKFFFRKSFLICRIQEHWREVGQWWLDESERFIYRVVTDRGLSELHYLRQNEQWVLYRLED